MGCRHGWTFIFSLSLVFARVESFSLFHDLRRPEKPPEQEGIITQKGRLYSKGLLDLSAVSEPIPIQPQTENNDKNDRNVSIYDRNQLQFEKYTNDLCERRNLILENVQNARDLATAKDAPIKPGKIFRTGRIGSASENDIVKLFQTLKIKTLIDLRSPTELRDDPYLMRPEVFGNFTNIVWKDRGRNKNGRVRELRYGESPVKERLWGGCNVEDNKDEDEAMIGNLIDDGNYDMEKEHNDDGDKKDSGMLAGQLTYEGQQRRERLFVSLMNEWKYVKGALKHVRKRDVAKTVLKSPGGIFSRRVREACKKPFLNEINGRGLQMLNQVIFRYGASGIKYVLEVCADENRHPIAFYCTAGKDRTGAVAAVILSLCGVDVDAIVEDYTLSANVYAEMDDNQAMVGALSQRSLDPAVFLTAPPEVIIDTLAAIKEEYGGIEAYCEWIGFGQEQQQQLRKALLKSY